MNATTRIGALAAAGFLTAWAQAITVRTNIPYTSPGGQNTLLDVFIPDGSLRPGTPTIVNVHGGGWTSGDKANVSAMCAELARLGYPVVNINYTLATTGAGSHPQAIKDVKAAIRWARTEGVRELRLPVPIIVAGESAGGHLAMMVGATNRVSTFNPPGPDPAGGYSVQGCIAMWGVADAIWDVETFGQDAGLSAYFGAALGPGTRALYASGSPINFAGPCDPPFVFYHGTADPVVPYQHSEMMAQALRPFGIFAEVNLAEGAGHGFGGFGGQVGMASLIADDIPTMRESRNPADFNNDGGVDGSDVDAFFASWENGDTDADINGDGAVDGGDVESFFTTWERGGCF